MLIGRNDKELNAGTDDGTWFPPAGFNRGIL